MPLQRIEKEVKVLQAGSNTRLEIPKVFVEMFGIKKGDPFVWVFDHETQSLTCQPKAKAGERVERTPRFEAAPVRRLSCAFGASDL